MCGLKIRAVLYINKILIMNSKMFKCQKYRQLSIMLIYYMIQPSEIQLFMYETSNTYFWSWTYDIMGSKYGMGEENLDW